VRQETSDCSLLLSYRSRRDERLSWPGWLTYCGRFTHISGYPSATGLAQEKFTGQIPTFYRCATKPTAMQSNNNNCSMSRLLDGFPCLYRRTEQGSRGQETSLRRRCGIACLSICLLKVSPVNARLTSPSYFHQYIFFSATSSVAIVTPTTKFVFVLFFPFIVQFLGSCF